MMEQRTYIVRFHRPHSNYGRIKLVNVPKEVTIAQILEKFPNEQLRDYFELTEVKNLLDETIQLHEFADEYGSFKIFDEFETYFNSKKVEFLRILSELKCREVTDLFCIELKSLRVFLTDEVRKTLGIMIIENEIMIPKRVTDFEKVTFKMNNGKLRKVIQIH